VDIGTGTGLLLYDKKKRQKDDVTAIDYLKKAYYVAKIKWQKRFSRSYDSFGRFTEACGKRTISMLLFLTRLHCVDEKKYMDDSV